MAETISASTKKEVIDWCGLRRSFGAVEYPTLDWGYGIEHQRLIEPIGNMSPAEADERYRAAADITDMAA